MVLRVLHMQAAVHLRPVPACTIKNLLSVNHKKGAFEVFGLGHGKQNGVIFTLRTAFDQPELFLGIPRRRAEHVEEGLPVYVIRA